MSKSPGPYPRTVLSAKMRHRESRWRAEAAKDEMATLHTDWLNALAKWLGHSELKETNMYCGSAPADSNCVVDVRPWNKYDRKCVFCGNFRYDIF